MEDEIRQLMEGFDINQSNGIEYHEFLAATISHSKAQQVSNHRSHPSRILTGMNVFC